MGALPRAGPCPATRSRSSAPQMVAPLSFSRINRSTLCFHLSPHFSLIGDYILEQSKQPQLCGQARSPPDPFSPPTSPQALNCSRSAQLLNYSRKPNRNPNYRLETRHHPSPASPSQLRFPSRCPQVSPIRAQIRLIRFKAIIWTTIGEELPAALQPPWVAEAGLRCPARAGPMAHPQPSEPVEAAAFRDAPHGCWEKSWIKKVLGRGEDKRRRD